MTSSPIKVLLIEDDSDDILLTQQALEGSKLSIDLDVINDGEEALSYLRRKGVYVDIKRPDLVLLDINLPKKNGWEVLQEIKSDSHLKSLPVSILTTSSEAPDIQRCYEMGGNSYVTKPIGIEGFKELVQVFEDFWFTIVKLPKPSEQ